MVRCVTQKFQENDIVMVNPFIDSNLDDLYLDSSEELEY